MKTIKKGRCFYHSTISVLGSFFAATLVSFITCTDPAVGQTLSRGPATSNDYLIDSQSEEFDYWMANHDHNPMDDWMSGMRAGCVFQIDDAKVTEKPTTDSVILRYESTNGQVDLLQKQVQAIAEHHNSMHNSTNRPGMRMGLGMGRGPEKMPWARMPMRSLVDSLAAVNLTETGAELTFRPVKAADLAQLREQIHQRLSAKPAAGCLMAP